MEGTFTYSVAGPGGTGGGQVIQRMPEPSSASWGVSLPEYSSIRPVGAHQQFPTNNIMPPCSTGVLTVNSEYVLGQNVHPGGATLMSVGGANVISVGTNVLSGGANVLQGVPNMIPVSSPNIYVNSNMPGTSGSVSAYPGANSHVKDTSSNSCIMDLDSQQPYNLDSSDLAGLDIMLNQNLSENLSSNLTLSENRTHQQQESSENMSDSLLSLKKEIINLNEMYKGGGTGDGDRQ